jgi:hypothetical protein
METISAVIFILTPPLAGILYEYDPRIVYPLSIGLIGFSIVISYLFTKRPTGFSERTSASQE